MSDELFSAPDYLELTDFSEDIDLLQYKGRCPRQVIVIDGGSGSLATKSSEGNARTLTGLDDLSPGTQLNIKPQVIYAAGTDVAKLWILF